MGEVHGIGPTGALKWAKKIMKAVLNTRCDAQKRPKIDAGNDCRKGKLLKPYDGAARQACQAELRKRYVPARKNGARIGPRCNAGGHARKTQEKASGLEGLSYRGGAILKGICWNKLERH